MNLLGEKIVSVAADKRLLRAGKNEGVATFNPEEDVEKKLDVLLEDT